MFDIFGKMPDWRGDEVNRLTEIISNQNETIGNMRQQISTLEREKEVMTIARTNTEIERAAVEAADKIVDFWFAGWRGRSDLHRSIKAVVRRPILLMLRGEAYWPPDYGGKIDDKRTT